MKGGFIQKENDRADELINYIVQESMNIAVGTLAKECNSKPSVKDVIINQYMVVMQVCSHAMTKAIANIARSQSMMNKCSTEEMQNFSKMNHQEKFEWASDKFGDIFKKRPES